MVSGAGNSMIFKVAPPPGNRAGLPETTTQRMHPLDGKQKAVVRDAGCPRDLKAMASS
jgi:hypothetical protein